MDSSVGLRLDTVIAWIYTKYLGIRLFLLLCRDLHDICCLLELRDLHKKEVTITVNYGDSVLNYYGDSRHKALNSVITG